MKGFPTFGQPAAQQQEVYDLNESTVISSLQPVPLNLVLDIYTSLEANTPKFTLPNVETTNESIDSIRLDIEETFLSSLTSLANVIDTQNRELATYKTALKDGMTSYEDRAHGKSVPTPFMHNYVQNLDSISKELDQAIKCYEKQLQAFATTFDIQPTLRAENSAILRISSKCASLHRHYNELELKLKRKRGTIQTKSL